MSIYTVLLFGITRDLLKDKSISFELTEPPTASDLLKHLKSSYPALQNLPSLRLAANHQFPEAEDLILPGMEIALIPPVSGG